MTWQSATDCCNRTILRWRSGQGQSLGHHMYEHPYPCFATLSKCILFILMGMHSIAVSWRNLWINHYPAPVWFEWKVSTRTHDAQSIYWLRFLSFFLSFPIIATMTCPDCARESHLLPSYSLWRSISRFASSSLVSDASSIKLRERDYWCCWWAISQYLEELVEERINRNPSQDNTTRDGRTINTTILNFLWLLQQVCSIKWLGEIKQKCISIG